MTASPPAITEGDGLQECSNMSDMNVRKGRRSRICAIFFSVTAALLNFTRLEDSHSAVCAAEDAGMILGEAASRLQVMPYTPLNTPNVCCCIPKLNIINFYFVHKANFVFSVT